MLTSNGGSPLVPCCALPQIVNSILTSALPQNPELVYTLLHRQVGGWGRAALAPPGLCPAVECSAAAGPLFPALPTFRTNPCTHMHHHPDPHAPKPSHPTAPACLPCSRCFLPSCPTQPPFPACLPALQEVFAPFLTHPRYSELMDNIQRVTEYFNRRVEESVAASGGAQQLSAER